MRLRDMLEIISENSDLRIDHKQSGTEVIISNHTVIREKLDKLNKLDSMSDIISGFSKHSRILNHTAENAVTSLPEYNSLYADISNLNTFTGALRKSIQTVIPDLNPFYISIKLPDSNNLKDLSFVFNELDTALNQVLSNPSLESGYSLENFDTGTYWVDLLIVIKDKLEPVAYLAVGYLIKFAYEIYTKERRKEKIFKQILSTYEKGNEALDLLTADLEREYKESLENKSKSFIEFVESRLPVQNKPEYQIRVKNAIDSIAKLLEKGVEIFKSINAPEEAKNIFPDFSKKSDNLLENSLKKLLEDKKKRLSVQ